MFSFGATLATFNVYGSLLDIILDCYGFTPDEVSYIGASMMISGIIAAVILGLYIERTLKYSFVFRALATLSLVDCIGFPIIMNLFPHSFELVLLFTSIMGIFSIPLMPLTF